MNSEKHTEMVNFRETPSTVRLLEVQAKKEGRSVSDLIRSLVRRYLSRKAA